MAYRILVADDEADIVRLLQDLFTRQGYQVLAACGGKEALELCSQKPDLILLDVNMPDMDGFTLCRQIRDFVSCPILFLTARDSVADRVKGLDLGADDYLVKPFAFDEFSARVRALLRRGSDTKSAVLSLEDLTLNTTNRKVTRAGQDISLTSTEYALLEYLLRNQGQVLTRSQIADHVWNYNFSYDSNVVDVYIRYLRNKIDRAFPTKLIHTIRGTGYTLRVAP